MARPRASLSGSPSWELRERSSKRARPCSRTTLSRAAVSRASIFSVSILQSLPIDDLVIAGNVHYLRGERARAPRAAPFAFAGGAHTPPPYASAFSRRKGRPAQKRAWTSERSTSRTTGSASASCGGGSSSLGSRCPREKSSSSRGTAAPESPSSCPALPPSPSISISTSQGGLDETWRELSLGLDKRFFEDALSLRAGLRAEAGGREGARPAFSAGAAVRIRFLVLEAAYQGSSEARDEALWFGLTVSP